MGRAVTYHSYFTSTKWKNTIHCLCMFIFCLLLATSCKQKSKTLPLFTLIDSSSLYFKNTVVDNERDNSFLFRNFYNGGGVALGDINNDGLPDVLLTSNMADNKLFLNKGNFKFEDITATSGLKQDSMWSTGATFVDINHDGFLDLYVCNSGHMINGNRQNKLYINQHNGTFKEEGALYGLDIKAYTTQASFFDYDLDGDLDCFIINNSPMPINTIGDSNRRNLPDGKWPVAAFLKGGGDHLYRNDNNKFIEVTMQAGIHGSLMSFGLGCSVSDVNSDGYPDIYVANDSYERDYLYINQKNGTFKDELETNLQQNSFSSMGADIADINNDGLPDMFTTDMLPGDDFRLKTLGAFDNIDLYNIKVRNGFFRQFMKNCLFVNNGNGSFTETANFSGVSATDWSWGALFFDADNDGYNDILVCNGINHDVTNLDFMDFFANDVVQNMVISGHKQNVEKVVTHIPINPMPNKAFRNLGNLKFEDAGNAWGLSTPSSSNGAAYADLDLDGDLDLVINNENQPSFVYRNNSNLVSKNNYASILLKGRGSNSFAIGAKMMLYVKDSIYSREVFPVRGFQSSVDYRQIIGLGANASVDSMHIIWPNRMISRYRTVPLNKALIMEEPLPTGIYPALPPAATPLLQAAPFVFDKHEEDDYLDYYTERNLPAMLSREGPKIGCADVDGDGLTDVYIGGAKGQAGQLYLQTAAGGFIKKEQPLFKEYADMEDVAVLFFDVEKDGDMDLFIGGGGNNTEPGNRGTQHRMYINDGKGNFSINSTAFGINDMNIAVAAVYDYNADGYPDLFVGGRSVPFNYGITPQSYLYRNEGGKRFTDVTATETKGIGAVGMVTGAVWANVMGDARKELIVTGEWMYPHVYGYDGKIFTEQKGTGLEDLMGMWQTVAAGDLNKDGFNDLVLGNIGENFYLRPTAALPVKLWLNDFDGNGNREQFLTRTINGKDMPVFLKRDVQDQFPGLKKQNLKHSDYALKTLADLFGKEKVAQSTVKQFNYCSSITAYNNGRGKFTISVLPMMVQLSSVNAVSITDVNGDGHEDLIMGGNLFTFPPQFGRLDGSYGHVLLGTGDGNFVWQRPQQSGLSIAGSIKDIQTLTVKGNRYVLFTQNDGLPQAYQISKK